MDLLQNFAAMKLAFDADNIPEEGRYILLEPQMWRAIKRLLPRSNKRYRNKGWRNRSRQLHERRVHGFKMERL